MPEPGEAPKIDSAQRAPRHGQAFQYNVVESPEAVTCEIIKVSVDDPANQEEVYNAVEAQAQARYWFLSKDYEQAQLIERYDIELAEGVTVGVFNFQERQLTQTEIGRIGHALGQFYHRLKDKSLWNLESIQIRAKDEINGKSGQPFRGLEVPSQRRFELFPATFEEGKYRGVMNTSNVEGATVHEAGHIILERALLLFWNKYGVELGWRTVGDVRIELPGGHIVYDYNIEPSRCPSEYASYQKDVDRAESVAKFLLDREGLDPLRAQLVGEVFIDGSLDIPDPDIQKVELVLPDAPVLNVRVEQNVDGNFVPIGRGRRIGKSK